MKQRLEKASRRNLDGSSVERAMKPEESTLVKKIEQKIYKNVNAANIEFI